ncbi:MAG: serine/threonine protein phosphatase [Chlamydiae bacterium]|nr:MAG: serine/threonine protein phosphatase [Chlamydiota bacterium]
MKIKYWTLWVILGCFMAAFAQTPAAYVRPQLTESNAWSIILIPDIQTYSKFGRNQGITELMTAWIAENLQPLHVLTVMQNGDLVEQNGIDKPRGNNGDQTSAQQWTAVSRAFERLDGKTPYILATGNHDYGIASAENRDTQFPKYFPVNRNSAWKGVLVECCPNRVGEKTLENAAYEFTTPQGRKLLIVSLEFAPSDPVLAWAKQLVARDAYKKSFVILMTHSFIKSMVQSSARIVKEKYLIKDVNYGQAIWDKLIFPSDNIRFVICGHIAGLNDPKKNVGFRIDKNHLGKPVSQMLFNAQTDGGGWHGNGGDGWLRILEFSEDGKTISVRTFSPLFANSPSTRHLAWRTEPYNQFVFELEE